MKEQQSRIILAAVLIVLGGLLLTDNLGLVKLDIGDIVSTWWPSLLILFGLGHLVANRGGTTLTPWILIGLGVLFQVITLGWASWGVLWPVIIIVIGVAVLLQGSRIMRRPVATGDDTVDLLAIFSGVERRVASSQFRGGKATAIFGGIELDLRDTQLAGDATLNATALFGGVELRVPESWDVQVHGSPLFGGIEDKQSKRASAGQPAGPRLEVYAEITFGGLEIKR